MFLKHQRKLLFLGFRHGGYKSAEEAYQAGIRERQGRSGIPALGFADGGDVEPVAKKTMPLLDLDGQEMDFRAEGGFVPIGRMEKADDVPARLSKNEFVFTAEAVRNAGGGDVGQRCRSYV